MAWVYKKEYQVNAIYDFTMHKNNFVIYPNPARDQLFIESKNQEDYEFHIINFLDQIVAAGKINGQSETVDISALPPNVYIFRINNKAVNFLKIN